MRADDRAGPEDRADSLEASDERQNRLPAARAFRVHPRRQLESRGKRQEQSGDRDHQVQSFLRPLGIEENDASQHERNGQRGHRQVEPDPILLKVAQHRIHPFPTNLTGLLGKTSEPKAPPLYHRKRGKREEGRGKSVWVVWGFGLFGLTRDENGSKSER